MKGSLIRMPARKRGISSTPGGAVALFLLLAAGCSYLEPVPEPVGPSPFEIGLARLADGDFASVEQTFRQVASRCESGSDGRRALLFLSFLALDPRNPAAHPDSAVLMSARVLNLPGNSREETLEAEALYVTALDYGADPELRIDPVNPGFAVRFGDCDQPFPPREDRLLPILDSPASGRLKLLDEEVDSLTLQNQQLRYTVRQLRLSSDSLQAQLGTLQAELERIRQLLRLPDTAVARRPPDIGPVRVPDTTFSRILGIDKAWAPSRP